MQLRLGVLGSLSDTTNLRRSVSSLEKQDVFDGYTKVVISVSDDVEYSAGTNTGRTLTLVCPWGTQAIAEKILSRVRGFQYHPFTASGAHLDPSVELGDGVTVGKVYSGVFTKDVSHGPLYTADVSAPGGEKINYKYEYRSPQDRKIERQNKEIRASLSIQADRITQEVTERQAQAEEFRATFEVQSQQISAKVSQTGGSSQSFAWELLSDHSSFISNGTEVFRVDSSGAQVNGIIRATGGKIGGFDIQSNYLSYNGQTWGGTNTTGAYIGVSGIQLGKNFKVDMQGNLTAASGTFTGNVYAGNIQYGGNYGTLPGSALTSHSVYGSQIGYNTISTSYTSPGINTSLGYADYANGVFGGWNTANYTKAHNLFVDKEMTLRDSIIGKKTLMVSTPNGGTETIRYLSW